MFFPPFDAITGETGVGDGAKAEVRPRPLFLIPATAFFPRKKTA